MTGARWRYSRLTAYDKWEITVAAAVILAVIMTIRAAVRKAAA